MDAILKNIYHEQISSRCGTTKEIYHKQIRSRCVILQTIYQNALDVFYNKQYIRDKAQADVAYNNIYKTNILCTVRSNDTNDRCEHASSLTDNALTET